MLSYSLRATALFAGWLVLSGYAHSENGHKIPNGAAQAARTQVAQPSPPIERPSAIAGQSRITRSLEPHNRGDIPSNLQQEIREMRDLKAQETMAYWAMAMFWAAVAQTGTGLIGMWLVFKTLRETRRAANASDEMAKDSRRVAQATIESVEIAQSTSRPWVQLDAVIGGPAWAQAFSFEVDLSIRMSCHGTIPATGVRVRALLFEEPAFSGHHLENYIANIVRERLNDLQSQTKHGHILFPGTYAEETVESTISFPDSDKINWTSVRLLVAVFLEYKFGRNNGHTVKVYRLIRSGRDSSYITLDRDVSEHIPARHLELIEGIYGYAD